VTHLSVTVADRVATVEINRPEVLNALHSGTHREMQDVFDQLELRDDVGAILLCGAGRAFCAGSDLREVGALTGADARRYVQLDFATKNRVAGSAKPVVAAIQGWCVGGGVELALACDIRVAADDAVFSMREVPLGSIPGSGGLQRLPAVVGLGVAKDWVLTGRDVDAAEADRRGLVTRVVPAAGLRAEATALAGTLAGRNPTALHLAKVALDPAPEPDRGLVATYQMLAGAACHDDEGYQQRTSGWTSKTDGAGARA
jgi:enoyl-CoA hydratase/carnithine racemase